MILRAGYEEINHTADRAIRVWAPDLTELLVQSARGMYSVLEISPDERRNEERSFSLAHAEPETLVVNFLSELLWFLESENLAFSDIHPAFQNDRMDVALAGSRIKNIRNEIKAVTYHDLKVIKDDQGCSTTIVFDV